MRRTRWLVLGAVSALLFTACTYRPFLPDPQAENGATVLVGESGAGSLIVEVHTKSGDEASVRALIGELASAYTPVTQGKVGISGDSPFGYFYMDMSWQLVSDRDPGPRTVDARALAAVASDRGYEIETLFWCPPIQYSYEATPDIMKDDQGSGCLWWTAETGYGAVEITLGSRVGDLLASWLTVLLLATLVPLAVAVGSRRQSRVWAFPLAWLTVNLAGFMWLGSSESQPSPFVVFGIESETMESWVGPLFFAVLALWAVVPLLLEGYLLARWFRLRGRLPPPLPPAPPFLPAPPAPIERREGAIALTRSWIPVRHSANP